MRWLPFALAALLGCSERDAPAEPPRPETPAGEEAAEAATGEETAEAPADDPPVEAPRPRPPSSRELLAEPEDPEDPLAGFDDVEALMQEPPDVAGALVPSAAPPAPAPAGSCVVLGDVATRVWPKPGPVRVVAVNDDGFVAAGYAQLADAGEPPRETLFVATFSARRPPRPLYAGPVRAPLGNRRQPPGLAALEGGRVAVVSADADGHVRLRRMSLDGRVEAPVEVDDALADRRFGPAVAPRGTSLFVAYVGTPSREGSTPDAPRLRLARLDARLQVRDRQNPAPSGMGGVAPRFLGEELAFVESREALSALLLASLDPDAVGAVLTPLSNVYDPVAIALARVNDQTLVAYTAVGQGARTAVGLLQVAGARASAPMPLVPGEGYGRLGVDVAAGPEAALFVADAPRGEDADAPREVRAFLARPGEAQPRLGPRIALPFAGDDQRHAHVARHADGTYAVVATTSSGVLAHFLRCDDGAGGPS